MKKFIPELDGLRGFCMIVLLMAHFPIESIEYNWIFIDGFYILSGFLISRILLAEKEKKGTFGQKFKTYWFRRMLRIFPPYYLYLAVVSIAFLLFSFPADYPSHIAQLATFTFNIGTMLINKSQIGLLCAHLWSMSIEEQFYLVLPILVFVLSSRWLKFVALFCIFFSPTFRYLYGEHFLHAQRSIQGGAIYWHTLSHLDAFFMGVGINIFKATEWKHKKGLLLGAFIMLIGAGFLNGLFSVGEFQFSYYIANLGYELGGTANYQYVWSYSLINIFFCMLITVIISYSGDKKFWLNKFLMFRPFTFLGTISYSFYVYHLGVLFLLKAFIFPDFSQHSDGLKFMCFLVYLGIMYIVGYLSYRFFESRFLRLKPTYIQQSPIEHPVTEFKKKEKKTPQKKVKFKREFK